MYSPVLSETMVKTLYRLKCSQDRPMTVVVEKLLMRSIASVDKGPVCEKCTSENNNDCRNCYFSCIKGRFKMLTINELRQFSGTEHWYRHLSGYLYTDGVQYVAQEGGAYWLIDKILLTTRAKNNLQEFGAWKLEVNEDKSATLVCEDGNYHELYREKIEWTDFPLNSIELWFENGVLILPSEH